MRLLHRKCSSNDGNLAVVVKCLWEKYGPTLSNGCEALQAAVLIFAIRAINWLGEESPLDQRKISFYECLGRFHRAMMSSIQNGFVNESHIYATYLVWRSSYMTGSDWHTERYVYIRGVLAVFNTLLNSGIGLICRLIVCNLSSWILSDIRTMTHFRELKYKKETESDAMDLGWELHALAIRMSENEAFQVPRTHPLHFDTEGFKSLKPYFNILQSLRACFTMYVRFICRTEETFVDPRDVLLRNQLPIIERQIETLFTGSKNADYNVYPKSTRVSNRY